MQAGPSGQGSVSGMQAAVNTAGAERLTRPNRAGQSLAMGCVGGIGAAAIGAVIWATISYLTEFQIGWMAVGVGLLVGIAVRYFGKGTDTTFGIVGGALALVGCLAGNLLTICLVLSREQASSLLEVISQLNLDVVAKLMTATFSPIDLLFYGIAIYEAYRFSVRSDAEGEPAAKTA